MTIHCFDVIYSPSSSMDSYLSSWLTSWTAWTEENVDSPSSFTEGGYDYPEVDASGFERNRFEWDNKNGRTAQEDAEYIVSNLIGETGYLASYCEWWIVKWHECTHDETDECGETKILDSSNNYSGQSDVPEAVINA